MNEILMDPQIMSSMFSDEDVEGMWDEADDRADDMLMLHELVDKLPEKYKNVYDLIYSRRLSQQSAATVMQVEQSTMHYYIERLTIFLEWFRDAPALTNDELNDNIKRLDKPMHQQMMQLYCETHTLEEVADATGYRYETVQRIILNHYRSGVFDAGFIEYLTHLRSRPRIYISGEE